MKIVHIMLCGPVTDGWSYQDNLLTKYHVRLGYETTMITSCWIWNNQGKMELFQNTNYINENGVKVIRLPIKGQRKLSYKFKRFENLYENIKLEDPDILFVHGVSFFDIDQVVKYVKENINIKVYVDNHSDFSNSATTWLSKNILHKVIWRHYAHMIEPYTEKFYGVIPARVEFLVDMYKLPRNKCDLLVMGADDDLVSEANDESLKLQYRKNNHIGAEDFLVITGGKIDQWKKQTLYLMEAISKIERDNVKLIIFGSIADELKGEFEKLLHGDERIHYVGWIDTKESYHYIAAADLAIFPGRHSVLWEQTVGQGIPMIVKDWEGTRHIDVGGNVIFLKNDSPQEIYEKLQVILENPEQYKHMKHVAKAVGQSIFLYSKIAEKAIEGTEKACFESEEKNSFSK